MPKYMVSFLRLWCLDDNEDEIFLEEAPKIYEDGGTLEMICDRTMTNLIDGTLTYHSFIFGTEIGEYIDLQGIGGLFTKVFEAVGTAL